VAIRANNPPILAILALLAILAIASREGVISGER
jgi:Tfp pilus assembly protein FimT